MKFLEAIIFDWAGTLVDYGSCAPRKAFVQLFADFGMTISEDEASEPMGMEKRAHIVALLNNPRIKNLWLSTHGSLPDESAIDEMYQRLIPLQIEQIKFCSDLVPGTLEVLSAIKSRQLKIGTTTGYNSEMIQDMIASAAGQGFTPDCIVASNQVPVGRPSPAAALKNLIELQVGSVRHCVKVDDTTPGIAEGLNAGMWTVAVVMSGNALGMARSAWNKLNNAQQLQERERAYQAMENSGAHYFIDSIKDLPNILADIEQRLSRGERP